MPPTRDQSSDLPGPPAPSVHDPALARALGGLRRLGRSLSDPTPMAGDVSRRRYFRANLAAGEHATSVVLALYPEDSAGACERCRTSTRLLHEAGIRVPIVIEADCGADGGGWSLLEDLGPATLYDLAGRDWQALRPYFEAAVDLLPLFAGLHREALETLNPPLDRALLSRELAMTRETFLVPRDLDVDPALWRPLETLCERLDAETPVPCHRDFGARNLVPLEVSEAVGVLDHQDVRLGPPLYDLASLLNDSLFPPPEAEEELLERAGVASEQDRVRYHRAAAQRTLKAVGSYAAFARRGTDRHLRLIAPTLERSLRHLERVPETEEIAPHLARRWRSTVC